MSKLRFNGFVFPLLLLFAPHEASDPNPFAAAKTSLDIQGQSRLETPTLVPGPDVIVGNLPSLQQFGDAGTQVGLAVGTESCNNGQVDVDWFALPSNDHPVIPQNLYRMSGGVDTLSGSNKSANPGSNTPLRQHRKTTAASDVTMCSARILAQAVPICTAQIKMGSRTRSVRVHG